MSDKIGHVGYSPDFKSYPSKNIKIEQIEFAPRTDANGDIVSIDPVKKSLARGTRVVNDLNAENQRLRDELDRISELVWENADRIDFTGYEDIKAALEEARGGEEA